MVTVAELSPEVSEAVNRSAQGLLKGVDSIINQHSWQVQ
jgi:hypothetical protein